MLALIALQYFLFKQVITEPAITQATEAEASELEEDWRKYALEHKGEEVEVKIPEIKKRKTVDYIFQFFRSGDNDYDDLIKSASRIFALDFHLIKAIIKAESNFDPKCVSSKGAKGLMQIMPDNFNALGISDPFDPWQNIFGGCLFYRQQLDRLGSHYKALWAYNAGPGAVDKYMPQETSVYVRRVNQYYYGYSGRLLF